MLASLRSWWYQHTGATLGEARREEAAVHDADVAVDRAAVEALVGTPVGDLRLYAQALTHRSLLRGEGDSHLLSNERLEFLGDAVLGFVVAGHLYAAFPEEAEGFLTRLRAKLVNGRQLARCARRIGLGDLILMSDNMDQSAGRTNQTILADAYEAVLGALYLDRGPDAALTFVYRTLLDELDLERLAERHDNYKSLLLEYAQAQGWPQPRYQVVEESGPSHDKTFTVEVLVDAEPRGQGTAGSKKKAEQLAAREALTQLQDRAAG